MLRMPETAAGDLLEAQVGTIAYYYGTTDPINALICDGRLIKHSDYPLLVELLNNMKQTGNPKKDINLPDCRGYFIRCVGGLAPKIGEKQEDAMRKIWGQHAFSGESWISADQAKGAFYYDEWGRHAGSAKSDWDNAVAKFDSSRVVPTAEEVRPKNIAFNVIIYTGQLGKAKSQNEISKKKVLFILNQFLLHLSFKIFIKRRFCHAQITRSKNK